MPSILVAETIAPDGLARLRAAGYGVDDTRRLLEPADLTAALMGFDALVVRGRAHVTAAVIDAAPQLRVIVRAGTSLDNIDLATAARRGVVVMHAPTSSSVTVAEHAIAMIFALARHIPQADASMRAGRWEKDRFRGRELSGRTLGVIGLGNVGRIVADRARGLKMDVVVHDPFVRPDRAAVLGLHRVSLDELFARADVITVHTPLSRETEGMISDAAISRMKPGVLLVNCARGGIFDEDAVARGLASGRLGGVALDVFRDEPASEARHPLLAFDNVIATPHIAASTVEAQARVSLDVADALIGFFRDGVVHHAVTSAGSH